MQVRGRHYHPKLLQESYPQANAGSHLCTSVARGRHRRSLFPSHSSSRNHLWWDDASCTLVEPSRLGSVIGTLTRCILALQDPLYQEKNGEMKLRQMRARLSRAPTLEKCMPTQFALRKPHIQVRLNRRWEPATHPHCRLLTGAPPSHRSLPRHPPVRQELEWTGLLDEDRSRKRSGSPPEQKVSLLTVRGRSACTARRRQLQTHVYFLKRGPEFVTASGGTPFVRSIFAAVEWDTENCVFVKALRSRHLFSESLAIRATLSMSSANMWSTLRSVRLPSSEEEPHCYKKLPYSRNFQHILFMREDQ